MDVRESNGEQAALWGGSAGQSWVRAQGLLELMFQPLQDLLVDAARDASPSRVLDVGCGTGGVTAAIARALGKPCVGVDISEPVIAAARARTEPGATFIQADAQAHPFEPASFDLVVSRFGVMFFQDPVRAFENLRHAAGGGGQLRAVVWRGAADNPFMTTAERAAAPLLPNLPARNPDGPGQFAFGDADRVRRVLDRSGWTGVDVRPLDVVCAFPEPELGRYLSLLGPVGLALQKEDEQTRVRVVESIRGAFDPFVHGAAVRFTAACWLLTATAG